MSDETKDAAEEETETKKVVVEGVHTQTPEEAYVRPTSQAVLDNLVDYTGRKLGFMMHWAPVTQLGLTESWPLSDGDRAWSQTEINWTEDIETFKEQYWSLNRSFNPVKFDPQAWAKLAKECGFGYVLFTTKHHDGFCMYDSKYSDYKVTSPDCPFHTSPRSNIVKEVFDAFRNEGLAVGAYFSKPDWRSPYFWVPEFGTAPTRNANYDPMEHPEIWEKFVEFTHAQLKELCTDYGRIDCLWLDGGWVDPSINHQDIRLSEVVQEIRETTQPHLIVADRTVGGENENILTPEQAIPRDAIHVPWETCLTIGRNFSFHYEEDFKSALELVHTFIEILAKGGSLALNITPQPDGALPRKGIARLREFGRWVRKHGEAIYHSQISPVKPNNGRWYTRVDGRDYCFFLYDPYPTLPRHLYLAYDTNRKIKSVRVLRTGQLVDFEPSGDYVRVKTDEISMLEAEYAECFVFEYFEE